MFGWFKRKSTPAPGTAPTPAPSQTEAGGPLLAYVLLNSPDSPLESLAKQMAKATCAGRRFTEVEIHDGTITAELGDELVAIALMPPYPWFELEGPCETSRLWPPEVSPLSLKDHKAHLLVTLMRGEGTPVERRLRLTAVTALVASLPAVTGILWPDAMQVHYPKLFIEMAAEMTTPEAPPLYLWIDFRVMPADNGKTALFTTGLKPLGHMEIEIPAIDMDGGELHEWTVNIAYYLLEHGPVLKDGDTIGMTAEQKVKIRHAPSRFGHEGKVLCFGE